MGTEKIEQTTMNSMENLSPARSRAVFMAVMLCMFAMDFSLFKLLPMQAPIMEFFNIEVSAYGYLNTEQNWFSILLTVPAGFLIRKMPCKWSMLCCFVLILGGSLAQILTTNYVMFVIGRTVEGGGFMFLGVIGYSLTANLAPNRKAGFWVSAAVTLVMLSEVIHSNVAPLLMYGQGKSFQFVFGVLMALQVVCLLIWLLVVPVSVRISGQESGVKPTREQTLRVYKNPSNWLVAIALSFFQIAIVSFSAYVIGYLVMKGMGEETAGPTYGYTALLGIVAMLIFGFLSDKFHTKRKLAIFSFFTGIIALLLLIYVPVQMIWIYVVVFGLLPRSVVGMSTAACADIAEVPMDVPIVNSFQTMVSQLLSVIGGIIVGYLLQFWGYVATIYVLCVMLALGGICWIFAKKVP